MSLTLKYQKLNNLFNQLEDFHGYSGSTDPKYQKDVFLALDTVTYLEQKVEELDLFEKSFFETLQQKKAQHGSERVKGNLREVETSFLFFFNLNFFKAMLISKINPDAKLLEQLGKTYYVKKSLDALLLFLEVCEMYQLISTEDLQSVYVSLSQSNYYEKEEESGAKKIIQKPVDRREVKIQRQKQQTEIKKKIAFLLKRKNEGKESK